MLLSIRDINGSREEGLETRKVGSPILESRVKNVKGFKMSIYR